MDAFVSTLSVDVHRRGTDFVLAPIHLGWLSLVFALVLTAFDEPDLLAGCVPTSRRLPVGGALPAVGLVGAFLMMLGLGHTGMPRRDWV